MRLNSFYYALWAEAPYNSSRQLKKAEITEDRKERLYSILNYKDSAAKDSLQFYKVSIETPKWIFVHLISLIIFAPLGLFFQRYKERTDEILDKNWIVVDKSEDPEIASISKVASELSYGKANPSSATVQVKGRSIEELKYFDVYAKSGILRDNYRQALEQLDQYLRSEDFSIIESLFITGEIQRTSLYTETLEQVKKDASEIIDTLSSSMDSILLSQVYEIVGTKASDDKLIRALKIVNYYNKQFADNKIEIQIEGFAALPRAASEILRNEALINSYKLLSKDKKLKLPLLDKLSKKEQIAKIPEVLKGVSLTKLTVKVERFTLLQLNIFLRPDIDHIELSAKGILGIPEDRAIIKLSKELLKAIKDSGFNFVKLEMLRRTLVDGESVISRIMSEDRSLALEHILLMLALEPNALNDLSLKKKEDPSLNEFIKELIIKTQRAKENALLIEKTER